MDSLDDKNRNSWAVAANNKSLAEDVEENNSGEVAILQQQLDEAGRLGLVLYEENQKLQKSIEELRNTSFKGEENKKIELQKEERDGRREAHAMAMIEEKYEKKVEALIEELERSEVQIAKLSKENKRIKNRMGQSEEEITKLKKASVEEHSQMVKNRFKIGAPKATASFQALRANNTADTELQREEQIETMKKRINDAEATFKTITKEKLTMRGKILSLQRNLKEQKALTQELIDGKYTLESELLAVNGNYKKINTKCERLKMEMRTLKDAEEAKREQLLLLERKRRRSSSNKSPLKQKKEKRGSVLKQTVISVLGNKKGNDGVASSSAIISEDDDDEEEEEKGSIDEEPMVEDDYDSEMIALMRTSTEINMRDDIVATPPPFTTTTTAVKMNRGGSLPVNLDHDGMRKQHVQRFKLSNELKSKFSMSDLLKNVEILEDTDESEETNKEKALSVSSTRVPPPPYTFFFDSSRREEEGRIERGIR